jgi:hypothetical protein
MMIRGSFALAMAGVLVLAAPARAADPKTIMGYWIEQLPGGGGMVTVFTPGAITAFGVNAANERISTPISQAVSYRDLGQTIGVDFAEGGGLLVAVHGPTSITLDFPDAAPHDLIPWRPPTPAPSGPAKTAPDAPAKTAAPAKTGP